MRDEQTDRAETLTYNGRLYDVSAWIERHPGGGDILRPFLGSDATCALHMAHDMRHPGIQKMLAKMDRGPDLSRPVRDFDRDYIALEGELRARGLFEPSLGFYVYKALIVLTLLGAAFVVSSPWLKGLLFGLFIQQAAFIAHDTCHDAAVPRRWREKVAWFFGSVCFGLDHRKWNREHNLHHMINSRPFEDPQMNTMPYLVYAGRELAMFERTRRPLTAAERRMMGYQYLWVLPVLFLYGRINAVRGDIRRALREGNRLYLKGAALHFALWGLLLAQGGPHWGVHALIFIPVTLAVSGLIHLQLILSHAYRPRLLEGEQLATGMKLQIISNQNVTTSWLDDWLHGGLQHHIEHHLFPRMPRHHLAKARPYVRALCEKHGLPYNTAPFPIAVWHLMKSLYRQGAQLRATLAAEHTSAGHV